MYPLIYNLLNYAFSLSYTTKKYTRNKKYTLKCLSRPALRRIQNKNKSQLPQHWNNATGVTVEKRNGGGAGLELQSSSLSLPDSLSCRSFPAKTGNRMRWKTSQISPVSFPEALSHSIETH